MSESRPKKRGYFTAEFKRSAAKLVIDEGMTRSKVASDLGVSEALVGRWVKEYSKSQEEAFPGKGNLPARERKIKELEAEVRQLKMERDILKKATAFFANHGR